jgi:hypothetical protein
LIGCVFHQGRGFKLWQVQPDYKTGKKMLYLGAIVVQLVVPIPKIKNNPYVIPADIEGHYLSDMQKS